jgi:hypothetical protein
MRQTIALFRIETGDALPIRNRGFRRTPEEKEQIRKCAQELMDAGIVRLTDSPWSANVSLISKKNTDEKRLALDYRGLNGSRSCQNIQ